MTKIYTFYNQKGGTGRTTTLINVAYQLADKLDQRVLIIDADPEANATMALGLLDTERPGLVEALRGQRTLAALAESRYCDNLHLVSADLELTNVEIELDRRLNRYNVLHNLLKDVQDSYDAILIDCGSHLGLLAYNALGTADYAVIPCAAVGVDARGAVGARRTIASIRENLNPNLTLLGISINRWLNRVAQRETVKQLVEAEFPIFKTYVGSSTHVEQSTGDGLPFAMTNPDHPISQQYLALAQELLNA